ncbi:MAG: DNA cytosine methyltransferase [Egibacteraceae bacterium]
MRIIDLFAGAGGLSEGFRRAGHVVLAGADIDPDACTTYARNFPESENICGDLRQRDVRERVLAAAESADVIVGGPPCQAFSQVRNHSRLVDDPRNSLYREFVRIVAEARPLALIMENVPGLAQMGAREQVASDLSLDGEYTVLPQLVDAADFGVPQTRKRLVFIGVRASLRIEPPKLVGTGATTACGLVRLASGPVRYEVVPQNGLLGLIGHVAERLADPEDETVVTAAQALSDLCALRAGTRQDTMPAEDLPPPLSRYQKAMREGRSCEVTNVSVPRINADTVLRLSGIPAGGNYRDLTQNLRRRYLTGQKWGPHTGSGHLDRRHYYAYRRLHPDLWSWTLNTKADSVYHYRDPRALSVREFARLQSFPDSFTFVTDPRTGELPGRLPNGATHSRYRQVGNAVPPRLAVAIAAALEATLEAAQAPHQSQRQKTA